MSDPLVVMVEKKENGVVNAFTNRVPDLANGMERDTIVQALEEAGVTGVANVLSVDFIINPALPSPGNGRKRMETVEGGNRNVNYIIPLVSALVFYAVMAWLLYFSPVASSATQLFIVASIFWWGLLIFFAEIAHQERNREASQ